MHARALRTSQNRQEDSVERAGSIILSSPFLVETVHEMILQPTVSAPVSGLNRAHRCLVPLERRARNFRFSSGVTLVSHRGDRSCGFPPEKFGLQNKFDYGEIPFAIYFMNSFHLREGGGSKLHRLYTPPICDFDLRATHARTLLPAALASVSFGFVLVRVRVSHKAIAMIYSRGFHQSSSIRRFGNRVSQLPPFRP